MPTIEITVNGKVTPVDVDPDTPLLWVLRDTLQLWHGALWCLHGASGWSADTILRDASVSGCRQANHYDRGCGPGTRSQGCSGRMETS